MAARCPLLVLGISAAMAAAAAAQAPAGAEFRVNTHTTNAQSAPSAAMDASGNLVVVWHSNSQDGDRDGVFGQRFLATGASAGAEFRVNSYVTDHQRRARVASDANGNFVVVWHSNGQDGDGYGVFGQRFSAAGAPRGSEFQVNTFTTSFQYAPSVASDPGGNFVVVWQSLGADGDSFGVFGQRFDALGIRQGAEFQVNTYSTSLQAHPVVASDSSGNFVVAWDGLGQEGYVYGVFARQFDAAGAPQGVEFLVNAYTFGSQTFPALASDASGNFVVAWTSFGQDGNGLGVFARRFDALGTPQGAELQINNYTTGDQGFPAVAADEDGAFVVSWRSYVQDGSDFGVFARSFSSAGAALGPEFAVNSYTTGVQSAPAIASNPDGDFVVTWQSAGQDGSADGVFAQRYGDLIFEDGLEAGSVSRWSSAVIDGNDLSVSASAALASTAFGLRALVDDTNSLYVQDDTPDAESRYRARFYFDPNGFDPGETQSHFRTRILIAQGSGLRVITIVLKRQAGAYTVEARVRRNDGTRADTGFFPITDGPHFIEFDWQRATGPGASDGSLQLWIDGGSVATLSGIDNDTVPIDQTRMGALSVKTGAAGTLYYDQFESRRLNFIGAE